MSARDTVVITPPANASEKAITPGPGRRMNSTTRPPRPVERPASAETANAYSISIPPRRIRKGKMFRLQDFSDAP